MCRYERVPRHNYERTLAYFAPCASQGALRYEQKRILTSPNKEDSNNGYAELIKRGTYLTVLGGRFTPAYWC